MLTYEELLAENRRLSEELLKLKAENSELKAKLGKTVASSGMTGMSMLCGESPPRRSCRRTQKRLPRFVSRGTGEKKG